MSYPRIHETEQEGNRVRNQRYRERHREQIRERGRLWMQCHLQENRDAINARRRERYAADPTPHRERAKKHAKANPEQRREAEARRRAAKKGSSVIEKIDRGHIYERDAGRCHICGKRVSRQTFELDHLVPLSKGGLHVAVNLATAHGWCNRSRKDGRLPAQLRLLGDM